MTSYSESAARNLGKQSAAQPDERYDMADEYMDVVYKLWECSFEEDAVVRDATAATYIDPAKVHQINHSGKHFTSPGFHLCEPSPQRTPVLFQAGSSSRGMEFRRQARRSRLHPEHVAWRVPSAALTRSARPG